MKYSLARTALALAATLTLASCGGGGKATFPINVTVFNVLYPGLVLSTNGMDQAVNPPAKNADGTIPPVTFVFPKEIEYGQTYDVIPKGQTGTNLGQMPAHQTCQAGSNTIPFPKSGTAGQLARIELAYTCALNVFPLGGVIKGLTATGLVLANGSGNTYTASPTLDANQKPTGADIGFSMGSVQYGSSYGVVILTQPTGQTCTLTGGANGTGGGVMDDAVEKAGSVSDLLVTCK